MDYSSQHGLSRFTGRKMMIFLYVLLLLSNIATFTKATLTESNVPRNHSTTETSKSEVSKREEPEAQRREHSFNPDGTVNYHGSGSGHDSGDLIPPPGGGVFNSPSIELSVGHTGASGPSALSNSYGLPIPDDTYGPPQGSFFGNNPGFHGAPPQQYGPPNNKYLPPPKPVYGPPKHHFRPPSPPKPVYGPPSLPQFKPLKSNYAPVKPNRSKPTFSSRPKPVYGPPKEAFGGGGFSHGTLLSPVTSITTQYGPPKISATYGTPLQPSTSYSVPKHPKHSHISAPPTPPVVKYDGWKPIPGLVSNAPSSFYGAPDVGHDISGGHGLDFSSSGTGFGGGIAPPPRPSYGPPSFGGTSFGSSEFGIHLQSSGSFGPPPKPSLSYGTPLQPSTSYGPPGGGGVKTSSKFNFLSSLKSPSSSYGLPEPSLAPSPPKPSVSYGPPQISSSYVPPKAPGHSYGPPKPPSISYGPPKPLASSFRPPKPPSISYGPPKPPSISYGPPKTPSTAYGPPSISFGSFAPTGGSFGPPKGLRGSYGPPKAPSGAYGPPKAPSSSYGLPKAPTSAYGPPQIFTTYSIPKPGVSIATPSTAYRGPSVPHPLQPQSSYGPPSFQGGLYKTPLPPNALYGVPTAPAPPTVVGCCGPSSVDFPSNTYGTPLTDLHAPVVQNVPSIELNPQFPSTGPSPAFPGAIPSTSYGTPLLPSTPASVHHSPATTYGVPTALPLRQPKNPVKFRPPVPPGLISSIGAKWGDSAVWGGNAHSNRFHGNTYIPPAVPDPDPGIQANKGNALVIPPPPAPPITYGTPSHGAQVSNQFTSAATSHSEGAGDLFPPPPPPPHNHNNYDIQQSASVELPGSNNLDHQGKNHFSSGDATSYSSHVDTNFHQQSTVSQGFGGGVQNIPIKGSQGSYTLQIQAAGGNSGEHIPHGEVLSNGLLQDILAAIENPAASGKLEQYGGQQSNDPVASEIGLNILKQLEGTHAQQSNSIQLPSQYGSDLSHSPSNTSPLYSKSNQVVEIPAARQANLTEDASGTKIAKYLSQNKIAFYYKNHDGIEERKEDGKDILLVQMLLPNNSTSSETGRSDFGALVSIKLQQNAQERDENGSESSATAVLLTSNDISGANTLGIREDVWREPGLFREGKVTENPRPWRSKGPVRTNRLETSRATPYPQPTAYTHTQAAVPDSTVQETEPADSQAPSAKPADQPAPAAPLDHCQSIVPGKIAASNVGHSCTQNSTTAPYNTTATIPVIQPSCVLPVEQCIGNGVLTNISSNGNCIPASPCFTTVIPANIVGTNSNACLPVTPRFQTPAVVDSSVAITDCRCQTEGSSCCHSAIASYPSAHAPTSMIFVPYSIPNFPPQTRGNLASNTSPCGGATPVKDAKGSRATSPRTQSKPDTSQHYHIFVGDLSPEIDTQTLRDAFAPFGEISDSRVVRDAQTLKSKGYGFVSFIKKSEAKSAIAAMNGRWLGSRSIRTNWATRKPPLLKADGNPLPLSFDEVYKQSSASNCTVYCGGIINGLTEELVQKIFSPFGTIQEIKVFKDKGYAFVRFSTKESAVHAIVAVHNTEVNGQVVKCSWGKENSDLTNMQTTAQFEQPIAGATFPYTYGQQMGYWYPQSFPATTTQIPGQYLQSGFSLGQFGYHQDFIGRLSMNLSSIWNGIPGQTQLPTAMQPIGQGTAIQQPNSMVAAYPVQRFQLPEEEWTAPSLLV